MQRGWIYRCNNDDSIEEYPADKGDAERNYPPCLSKRNLSFITENLAFSQTFWVMNERMDILRKYNLWTRGDLYFIDEVQLIEEWEKSVNSYSQDYTEEYELLSVAPTHGCCPVSLPRCFPGDTSNSVYPFSYQEYTEIRHLEQNRESYMGYMNTGGIRTFVLPEKQEVQRNYLSALKDTILLKDIIQRYSIRDPRLLEDLFAFLVGNASNLVSIGNIVNYFKSQGRKTSYDAVAAYIGYIEDSFLAYRCERFDLRGKEILSGTAKYYINDLAFKISSIPEQPMVWVINWRILSIWSCSGQAMMSIPDVPKKRGGLHRHGKATIRYICNPPTCW